MSFRGIAPNCNIYPINIYYNINYDIFIRGRINRGVDQIET